MRHNKKAQGLPLVKIVTAAIVLLVLVVVALIGPGMIKKGFNNLLCAVDLCKEAEGSGDYILRTSVEFVDEDHVILHFTPNPTRCAEIADTNPYKISQGFTHYPEKYIPDGDYEEVITIKAKLSKCNKEVLVENITLVRPDEYGTHMLRIDVYGEEQHNIPLEKVPVEVNEWERLLLIYLNASMSELNKRYDNLNALSWSYEMHKDPAVGFWSEHPADQSLDLNEGYMNDALDLLGEGGEGTIDDIPDLYGGTFADFVSKIACIYPGRDGSSEIGAFTKNSAMQIVMTALFGDLQDFDGITGKPPTEGQVVYRVREGVGPRGYNKDENWKNQLLPMRITIECPPIADDDMDIYGGVTRETESMKHTSTRRFGGEDKASIVISGSGCLNGKELNATLAICPESVCEIAQEGGEEAPEEPEPQEPGERGEGDCYVSSMDPCGGLVLYIENGDWICMYDATLGVEHARHCENGAIVEVKDCSCSEHACEMTSSLDESGWGCE